VDKLLWMAFALVGIAYLLGSISSAILISRLFQLPDPRTTGSKNPGATNVLRTGGKSKAALVLIGDVLKGLLPVLLAKYFLHLPDWWIGVIGLSAVIGHIFPVFYHFKGGKGIATALGVYFGLSAGFGLVCGLIWLLIFLCCRYSSLSSLIMVIAAPIVSLYFFSESMTWLPLLLLAIVCFYKHQANIQRLWQGTESKMSKNK